MEDAPHVVFRKGERFVGDVEQAQHVRVSDDAALGRAGGAGRVDHIGGLRGADGARRGRAGALVGDIVEADRATRQLIGTRQAFKLVARADEGDHCAVVDEEAQALVGIGGIERHVSRAGLEDRKHADREMNVAPGRETDAQFGASAEIAQRPRECIGARVELCVGERAGVARYGNGIRMPRGDLLECIAQVRVRWYRQAGRKRRLRIATRRLHWNEPRVRVVERFMKHIPERIDERLRRELAKARIVRVEVDVDRPSRAKVAHIDAQRIALRGRAQRRHRRRRAVERRVVVVPFIRQAHFERQPALVARQGVERIALMAEIGLQLRADPRDERRERVGGGRRRAQHAKAEKEPDRLLVRRGAPIQDRQADREIACADDAKQRRLQNRRE